MRYLLKITIGILAVMWTACSKDSPKIRQDAVQLKIHFSANQTSLSQGDVVNFTDETEGYPLSWQWYFEGGVPSSSNKQHPENIRYDDLGEFDVTLIVTNAYGTDSIVKKSYISVKGILPTVETGEPLDIDVTEVEVGGEVIEEGTAPVEEVGIVWSDENERPTINDSKMSQSMSGVGDFLMKITDLQENTTYHYRAYAQTADGVGYGKSKSFTTWELDTCDFIDERFIDSRDGQSYRYFDLGNQRWMGDNLNYNSTNSWCYDDDATNCDFHGRLYTVSVAQDVCPDGWRLPTEQDWNILIDNIGSQAGVKMKAKNIWGMNSPATNLYCFSAKPSGYKDLSNGRYMTMDFYGYWWTASENSNGESMYVNVLGDSGEAIFGVFESGSGFKADKAISVRCIKK